LLIIELTETRTDKSNYVISDYAELVGVEMILVFDKQSKFQYVILPDLEADAE
jgi:hypothetical protein